MNFKLLLVVLSLWVAAIVADITIKTPSSTNYAVLNTTVLITWEESGNVPADISIKLVDASNKSFSGQLGIGTTQTNKNQYPWLVQYPEKYVADNQYEIVFLDNSNPSSNAIVATSEKFSIKPEGTAPPSNNTSTSTTNSQSSSGSPTSTGQTSTPSKGDATTLASSFTLLLGLIAMSIFNTVI